MTYQAPGWAKQGRVPRRGCGYTMAANETGLPAIGAPAGHNSAGLTIRVQHATPPVRISSNGGR